MDLQQQAQIIDNIHEKLTEYVGTRVRVRANMGRSKIVESEGKLVQVYDQLFIVDVDRKRGRTARQSYQYVDILTGMVELYAADEPIFEPFIIDQPYEEFGMIADILGEDIDGEEKLLM